MTPGDNYDIALLDQHGVDLLRGLGQDLDQAATFDGPIVFAGTSVHVPVAESDVLRLKIGDTSLASANLTVTIYYGLGA